MKRTTTRIRAKSSLAVFVTLVVCAVSFAASNMGFKVVKPVVYAGTGQIGNMWTSIPFLNPYGNAGTLCARLGLTSTGIIRASITALNPVTGTFTTVNCGTAWADALQLVPGRGVQIRQPNTVGAPEELILLGSHDNALEITIPDAGTGQIGNYRYSLPYHATAKKASDLCAEAGLSSTGIPRAVITRLDAATGSFSTVSCGTTAANNFSLIEGEAIQIREPNGPKTFLPAHD